MRVKIAIFAALTAIFCACNNVSNSSLEDFRVEKFRPEFATGFRIDSSEEGESSLITISNPWQGAYFEQQIFVARNHEKAPAGFRGQVHVLCADGAEQRPDVRHRHRRLCHPAHRRTGIPGSGHPVHNLYFKLFRPIIILNILTSN